MKTVYENTISREGFSDRLRFLYAERGIDLSARGWSGRVAKEMVGGIIPINEAADSVEIAKQRQTIQHRLVAHLDVHDVASVSGEWLVRYASYFGCSAAYLFGEIALPTPEITDIHNATGLSPDAIRILSADHRDVQNRISSRNEGFSVERYNETPEDLQSLSSVLNFLLTGGRADRGKGGLLDLLRAYFATSDDATIDGLPDGISSCGRRGFHIESGQVAVGMYYARIQQILVQYRALCLRKRKKP